MGCGSGPNVEEIVSEQPHALLPRGAAMVYGFRPADIVANPLVVTMRTATGSLDADLPLAGVLKAMTGESSPGDSLCGLIDLFGVDANTQVKSGAWGLYKSSDQGTFWALAITGGFEEKSAVARMKIPPGPGVELQVDKKEYLNSPYYTMTFGSTSPAPQFYVAHLAPGVMLAARSEGLAQHAMMVWRGKADGLLTDAEFAPLLQQAATSAPAWATGWGYGSLSLLLIRSGGVLAPAENLGKGVKSFHASAELGAQQASISAVFDCENSASAEKQRKNYEELLNSRFKKYIYLGPLILELIEKVAIVAEGPKVRMSFTITAAETDALAKEVSKRIQQMKQNIQMFKQDNRISLPPDLLEKLKNAPRK